MKIKIHELLFLALCLLVCLLFNPFPVAAQVDQAAETNGKGANGISIPEDLGTSARMNAAELKKDIELRMEGLFERQPWRFNADTVERVWEGALNLPRLLPPFLHRTAEQAHRLGWPGSLLVLFFLAVVLYSFFEARKINERLQRAAAPLEKVLSGPYYPYFLSVLKIIAAVALPLSLYALFLLVEKLTGCKANWFVFTGSLLNLWSIGAFALSLLHEILLPHYLPLPSENARSIYRASRRFVLFAMIGTAVFQGAQAFRIPGDILALIRFLVSVSIVCASLSVLLKKPSIMGMLPELPYGIYQLFKKGLDRFFYPIVLLSFLSGLLWCAGYRRLAEFLWLRTWAVAAVFLIVVALYHNVRRYLIAWISGKDPRDEVARSLHQSMHVLTLFSAVTITLLVTLQLLGLFQPIKNIISFPLVVVGDAPISMWILAKAAIIVTAFVFFSRFMRSYLDYKVYPAFGIDVGLAYSINTLIGYALLGAGVLFALRAVGLDFRVLMVFAGAIGIGIGLGLQNLAANLISGFILIFGRTVRKGDWIEIGGTLGIVQEVSLRATRVKTRDNIEYLMPNSELTAGTIINYTLSDPEIRVHIPVGVAYSSDPREVVRILLRAAEENPHVSRTQEPKVWFVEYGDNSINFELLVWIDVRKMTRREISSQLYFEIFDALGKAGIEIPFPQRDLRLRSGFANGVVFQGGQE